MESADIDCVLNGKMLSITVSGEIDHHTAKKLREKIDREIFYHRPDCAILDLGSISFMDSSGLGLILGRYTRMKEMGGILKISNPTKQIEKIILLAGLEKLIPILKTNERTQTTGNVRS